MRFLVREILVGLSVLLPLASVRGQEIHDLFQQRDFVKGRTQAESVWHQAKGRGELLEAALAAANVGACLTMLGLFDDARLWLDRSQEILAKKETPGLLGQLTKARAITSFLGSRQYGQGDVGEALTYLKKAKDLLGAKDVGLQWVGAEIRGQSEDATLVHAGYEGYVALVKHFEQRGDSLAVARCAVRLARIEGEGGDHRLALDGCMRAAAIFEQVGERQETALALRNAGHAHRKLGEYEASERALKKALDLAGQNGDSSVLLRVMDDLSRLYAETDQYELSIDFDRKADALMGHIAEELPEGYSADSVSLSFQHLLLMRFASLLPYEVDLFAGFYDALVLHPVGQN
jgi:tetratricopeptide (TPR) repeat protein